MQPLSNRIRRLYLALFMFLFAALLPLVIFYADGWRYKSNYGFVRTGGIYVAVPYQDAKIFFNGAAYGTSGFLDHTFYVGDLAPSAYIVHVERDGYQSWDKLLVVQEQLVTDAKAVLIPKETPAVRLIVATSTPEGATTTRAITRATYTAYTAAFVATTASSSVPVDEANGVGLFIQKGKLVARWIQSNAFPPSQFCERPSVCADEIVLDNEHTVSRAFFFRGGVVYASKDGTVRFKEVDVRDAPVAALLFTVKNPDIRVISDALVVKSGTTFYEISL